MEPKEITPQERTTGGDTEDIATLRTSMAVLFHGREQGLAAKTIMVYLAQHKDELDEQKLIDARILLNAKRVVSPDGWNTPYSADKIIVKALGHLLGPHPTDITWQAILNYILAHSWHRAVVLYFQAGFGRLITEKANKARRAAMKPAQTQRNLAK